MILDNTRLHIVNTNNHSVADKMEAMTKKVEDVKFLENTGYHQGATKKDSDFEVKEELMPNSFDSHG
eukprot:1895041-Pyramimonas_sp.AAC.1